METINNTVVKKVNWKKRIFYIILICLIILIGKKFLFSTPSELKLKHNDFEFSKITKVMLNQK